MVRRQSARSNTNSVEPQPTMQHRSIATILAIALCASATAATATPVGSRQRPFDGITDDSTSLLLLSNCFLLDASPKLDSDNTASICISPTTITLMMAGVTSATFNVTLVRQGKCANCNRDVYKVAGAAALGKLTIAFNGRIDPLTNLQKGTVRIGGVLFRYQSENSITLTAPLVK
jgi:hypothetical protein